MPIRTDKCNFTENITSNRTEALFLALTVVFLSLHLWRMSQVGLDFLAGLFLFLSLVFLFYSINYRTLTIQLNAASLRLKFGLFGWTVPLDNIETASLDELPALMKYGGAGIHFMTIRNRYRASFNFLEYPRVVIALKKKAGLVRDISFSTRRPEEIVGLIHEATR